MTTHVICYYAEWDREFGAHELSDMEYFCSAGCLSRALWFHNILAGGHAAGTARMGTGAMDWGAWPCATDDTDQSVWCATCGGLMQAGDMEDPPETVDNNAGDLLYGDYGRHAHATHSVGILPLETEEG